MKWKRFYQMSIISIAAVFILTSTVEFANARSYSSPSRSTYSSPSRSTYKAPSPNRSSARIPTARSGSNANGIKSNNRTASTVSRPATKTYKPDSKAGKAQKSIGKTSKKDWDAKRANFAKGKTSKILVAKNKYPDAKRKKYLKKYGNTHGGHVYNDPFNHMYIFMFSGLWWHHHHDEIDTSHYDDDDLEDIREDMARYEGTPRNPNYMDEGMDESVMYSDGYLARVKTGTFGLDDSPIVESSGIGGCFIATAAHAGQKKKKKKKKKKKLSFGDDDDDDFEGGGCFIATAQAADKKKKKVVKKPVVNKKAPLASTTAKPAAKVYDKKGNQIDPKTGKVIKKKKPSLFDIEDDGDINVLGVEVYDPDDDEEDDDDERYERRQHNDNGAGAIGVLLTFMLFMVIIIILYMYLFRNRKA